MKDLIFVDPEDETPVKRFVEILARTFEVVEDNDKLGEVLTIFKQGRGHMGIVRGVIEFEDGRDNEYKIKGIVTLEDIVEAILGDEIIDEVHPPSFSLNTFYPPLFFSFYLSVTVSIYLALSHTPPTLSR